MVLAHFFLLAAKKILHTPTFMAMTERPQQHLGKQAWLIEDNLETHISVGMGRKHTCRNARINKPAVN